MSDDGPSVDPDDPPSVNFDDPPSVGSDDPPSAGDASDGGPPGRDRSAGVDPAAGDRTGSSGVRGALHRFWTAEAGGLALLREMLSSVVLVALVAGLLFGISGVWPPMVAVESGSMNPHMYRGDLVFIVQEQRLTGPNPVEGTGVVPHRAGLESDYRKFGDHGDVIVFRPNGRGEGQSPIIHRAQFYVEDGENWYGRADQSHVRADSCAAMPNCPAPNEGFITRGDNPQTNQYYDQVEGRTRPVRPEWIEGKAMVRVPGLGHIRLAWGQLQRGTLLVAVAGVLLVGARRRPAA